MTQPVRIESGTDAGTVVGDTDDERAATRRVRHAGHFRRQIVGCFLVGRPTGQDGSSGAPPARLLFDVHPFDFDSSGRLTFRQSVQRPLEENVDRVPPKNFQCHERPPAYVWKR